MHICFASLDYPVEGSGGGVGTVTRTLAQGMADRGHKVSVIRLGEQQIPVYSDGRVEVHTFLQGSWHYYLSRLPWIGKHLGLPSREMERSYALVKKLKEVHRNHPIDLVEYSEEALFFSAFSSLRKQCTMVARLHGTEYAWIPKVPGQNLSLALKLQRIFQRYFLRRCPHLIAVSTYYKEILKHDLGERVYKRIHVLGNPIAKDDHGMETLPPNQDKGKSFLFVGRIQDAKGVDILVRALGRVKATGEKVRLFIAGNEHPSFPKHRFEQLLREHNLSEEVIVLGHLSKDSLVQRMKHCCAVVVPSYFETFGLVAMEALQVGARLIHTRVGMMADAPPLPGVLVVEPNDVHGLEKALVRMIKGNPFSSFSPSEVEQRKSFLRNFSLKHHLDFLEQLPRS